MNKTDYKLISLALIGFLFFQAILVYYVRITDYDEAVFLDVARNIHRVGLPLRSISPEGRLYFIHTPLYLYLVSASVYLFGESLLWTRMVTMMFAIGSIVLTYLIVRREQTAVSSFVAGLLLALNTFFAIYSYFLTMEVPMMFFILMAIYLLSREGSRPFWQYFGAGIAVALAIMLKELALVFLGVTALYVFVFGRNWQERILQSVWFVLPTIIATIMWVLWGINLDKSKFWAGTSSWLGFVHGANNVAGTRNLQMLPWLNMLGNNFYSWGMIILFVASIFAYFIWFRRKLPQIFWLLLLYFGFATGISFFISIKEPRHIIALIPVVAMMIGMLVDWDSVWRFVRTKPMRLIPIMVVVLLLAWNISPFKIPPKAQWEQIESWWEPMFSHRIFYSQQYYSVLEDTGHYLAEITSPETVITVMHEGPIVGYYADRPNYFLYTMKYPRVLEVLRDTEFLVIDRQVFFELSSEEIDSVMQYIENNFEIIQILENQGRQVSVYKHQ
ncbi:MAG: glycosyltransferase family 39 protein [Anaerolineae bacterium]|nr:glycosyltransferase family 39 protein [Anaerolineae bacterium]